VLAANVSGVPVASLNLLTLGYVATRVVYNVAYVWLCTNRRRAALRSATWLVGVSLVMTLWIKAANRAMV
jgi:uncharacterized MAPEG superfamily protein